MKIKYIYIVGSNQLRGLIADATRNEFISATEYAERVKKSVARIKKLCAEERIPGAVKKNGGWFIPRNAAYPKDGRKKRQKRTAKAVRFLSSGLPHA